MECATSNRLPRWSYRKFANIDSRCCACSRGAQGCVLVGGTGTGKTHLAIAIASSCIRSGARGRFYNVVDLVNQLETETRNGRQGRIADHLTRKTQLQQVCGRNEEGMRRTLGTHQ